MTIKNGRITEQNRHELAVIVPQLKLDGTQRVLDVGCGVGRWTDAILENLSTYHGVDLSPKLISISKKHLQSQPKICFEVLSALEVGQAKLGAGRFDVVIVSGLLLYLNDAQVLQCLRGIGEMTAPGGRMYLREPLAIGDRLTLDNFYSEELKQKYSSIYRGHAQMQQLISEILAPFGFEPAVFKPLYPADSELNNRRKTQQYFAIIELCKSLS